jgi:HlyD family secretion protein
MADSLLSTTAAPAKQRRRRIPWIAIAIAVLLIGAGFGWTFTHGAQPVRYVTAAVTRGGVARTVTASGTVNPVTTVQVGSYVSGVIQSVSCDYNTHVIKGQVCARIDPRPYQSTVDQDQANLDAARAQYQKDQTAYQFAQVTYQRNADLASKGLVAQDALDQAKSAADQAKAQLQLDQTSISQRSATVQAAKVNLGYTTIVSPVDGTVVSRNITQGQTVAASFQTPTLFLIAADLTKMQVDTNVSESDIGGLQTGERATFSVEAFPNRSFAGAVTQVRQAPQTVQNVVTYDVVVSTQNPQSLLKPGMTATVHVVTAERNNVLRVPDQALRFTPGGVAAGTGRGGDAVKPVGTSGHAWAAEQTSIWVLRNGSPVRVPVTVGLDDGTNAEIVSGELQPNDQVIVSQQSGATSGSSGRGGRGGSSTPRLRF